MLGYCKALKEYGIPYDERLVFEGNYDRESGKNAVEYFYNHGLEIDSIFAFNDMSAYGVYNGLKEYGLSVPDDISVVGYDDIFFSEILDTPLTTIRQPVYEMGVEGMKLLLNEVESTNHIKKCITFQPKIIIRESVKNVRR